jgi:hypothetical protein
MASKKSQAESAYKIQAGKLIFKIPQRRTLAKIKLNVTEEELKDLNLQRLLIKRSRVQPKKGSLSRQFK